MGNYTEFLGLIVPGGWEEFFRFIGEPYTGPLFPLSDDRNPFEVLIPKLKAAAQKFDMVPVPQHPSFQPQPWVETENHLPGSLEPYFLRNGSGPKYLSGGTLCRPLATTAESRGRFSIGSIEGSSLHYSGNVLVDKQSIKFEDIHHCFQVVDGRVEFTIDSSSTARLSSGESIYIPRQTAFRIRFTSKFAKAYAFSNGGGIVELLCKAGQEYDGAVIPEKVQQWDAARLSALCQELSCLVE